MMDTTALNTLRAARGVLEAHGFDAADLAACITAAGQANEDERLADLPDGWTLCPRCNERTCVLLDGVCFYCHSAEINRREQLGGVRNGRFDHLPNGCTCSVDWVTFAPGGLSGICGACGQRWEIDNGRVARRVEKPACCDGEEARSTGAVCPEYDSSPTTTSLGRWTTGLAQCGCSASGSMP